MSERPQISLPAASSSEFRPWFERIQIGKALRATHPREGHACWRPGGSRLDPIDVLEESNRDRLPELVPIRYGRMLRSPFAFLRGSAPLMAYDLASLPTPALRCRPAVIAIC